MKYLYTFYIMNVSEDDAAGQGNALVISIYQGFVKKNTIVLVLMSIYWS